MKLAGELIANVAVEKLAYTCLQKEWDVCKKVAPMHGVVFQH